MQSILADHASIRSSEVALRSGDASVTYGSLYQRTQALSEHLLIAGVSSLAIDLENSIDWVIADLACMFAGITCVPMPAFFSNSQREHVLATASVDAIIGLGGNSVAAPGLDTAGLEVIREAVAGRRPVKITFTSGSTGDPKGVVLAHDDLFQIAGSIRTAMEKIDVQQHLCMLPLATLLENVAGVYAPLIKGITVLLPSSEETGLQGSSGLAFDVFSECLEAWRPDSLILVPQLLMALVTLTELEMIKPDYLRMVAVGGGRISRGLLAQCASLGIPAYEGYGLSEAGSVVTLNLPGDNRPGTVGKVLPHARLRVSDDGELEVGGVLMQGYIHSAQSDSEEEPRQGEWLRTGDLGEIDADGFVTIHGRRKNIFITAFGRNVNPEWVESELTQQPAIAHALFTGEARETNIALIWPRFETTREAIAMLVDRINADLPDYARIHEFVLMETPLDPAFVTSNGRLKRQPLTDAFDVLINPTTTQSFPVEEAQ